MMKTTRKGLATTLALSLFAVPAFAETLKGALSQTLARNPSLSAARSTYEANYKSQFVTLSDMLPQVSAFATQTRSDTDAKNAYTKGLTGAQAVERDEYDNDSYGLRVTQQLFTSGKNVNAFRSKRAEIRAEQANLLNTEQQILLAAISAYLDVRQAGSVYDLRQKNVEVLENQLEAVQDRFSVGVVTRTDVAQSQAAAAGARAAALGAQADLRAARAVYREVVGIEAEALEKPGKLPRLPRTLDRALSIARKESPLLKSAQETAASGRFTSYSTVGGALPSVNLTGTYARNENPQGGGRRRCRHHQRAAQPQCAAVHRRPFFGGHCGVA